MHDCILFLINRSARLVQCCLLLVLISERDCRAIHLTERSYLCWSGLLLLEIYLPFPVGISLLVSSRVYGAPYLLAVRQGRYKFPISLLHFINGWVKASPWGFNEFPMESDVAALWNRIGGLFGPWADSSLKGQCWLVDDAHGYFANVKRMILMDISRFVVRNGNFELVYSLHERGAEEWSFTLEPFRTTPLKNVLLRDSGLSWRCNVGRLLMTVT